jgi:Cu/Zn superoxide dismutase
LILVIDGGGKSGVAMLGGEGSVRGVVRLVEAGEKAIIEGTIDGLAPGQHGLHIHQFGDISEGCQRYLYLYFTSNFKFRFHPTKLDSH